MDPVSFTALVAEYICFFYECHTSVDPVLTCSRNQNLKSRFPRELLLLDFIPFLLNFSRLQKASTLGSHDNKSQPLKRASSSISP